MYNTKLSGLVIAVLLFVPISAQAAVIGTVDMAGGQSFNEEQSMNLDGLYSRSFSTSGNPHVTLDYLPDGRIVSGRADGVITVLNPDLNGFDVVGTQAGAISDLAVLTGNKIAVVLSGNIIGIINDVTTLSGPTTYDTFATYNVSDLVTVDQWRGDKFVVATSGGTIGIEDASSVDGVFTNWASGYSSGINDIALSGNTIMAANSSYLSFEDALNLNGSFDDSYWLGTSTKTSVAALPDGRAILARNDGYIQIQNLANPGLVDDFALYNSGAFINDIAVTWVPEPSSFLLLTLGTLGLLLLRRRR